VDLNLPQSKDVSYSDWGAGDWKAALLDIDGWCDVNEDLTLSSGPIQVLMVSDIVLESAKVFLCDVLYGFPFVSCLRSVLTSVDPRRVFIRIVIRFVIPQILESHI